MVLSETARVFDPLGLLAPTIVAAKIYLQSLWAEWLSWDKPLPTRLAQPWRKYRIDLQSLNTLNIPRSPSPKQITQLWSIFVL